MIQGWVRLVAGDGEEGAGGGTAEKHCTRKKVSNGYANHESPEE